MAGVMALIPLAGNDLTERQERYNMLYHYENKIRKELATIQESAVYIGYALMDIDEQGLYRQVYHQGIGDYCKNIFQYASQELDIPKTTAFNLMAVALKFSDGFTGLKAEYKNYSFSQLVELLPMSEEARKYADPRMSIRELRQLKKGERVCYYRSDGLGTTVQLPKELVESTVPTSEQFPTIDTQKNSDVGTKMELSESAVTVPEENIQTIESESNTQTIPTSEQKAMTNREYLNGLADEEFVKALFDKYDELYKQNFDPDMSELEIDINAKIDLELWLGKNYIAEETEE